MARPCTSKPTERCRPFTFHVNTKTERPPHRNINFPYLCFAILYKATIYTRRVHTYIVCVCVYVCVYIYIYIYIYTHTQVCMCYVCVSNQQHTPDGANQFSSTQIWKYKTYKTPIRSILRCESETWTMSKKAEMAVGTSEAKGLHMGQNRRKHSGESVIIIKSMAYIRTQMWLHKLS